jgi:hypothetical protein
MNRPNILWYCTDQQCFDTIGALGNPRVQTLGLDFVFDPKTNPPTIYYGGVGGVLKTTTRGFRWEVTGPVRP